MSNLILGQGLQCEFYIPNQETFDRLTGRGRYRFKENIDMYTSPDNVFLKSRFFSFKEKVKHSLSLQKKHIENLTTTTPKLDFDFIYSTYRMRQAGSSYLSALLEEFGERPVIVTLNRYDIVPEDFLSYPNERKVAYLIQRQYYSLITLSETYRYIKNHNLGDIYPFESYSLYSTMSNKQQNFLFKKLVEFGCLEKDRVIYSDDLDTEIQLNEIGSQNRFHCFFCNEEQYFAPPTEIFWKRQTGMFAYMMEQLYKYEYVRNPRWQNAVHERFPVYSKYGKRLTFSNLSSSLYACQRTKKASKFMREIDKIMLQLRLYEG